MTTERCMLVPKFFLGSFSEARRMASRYLRSLGDGGSMELELVDTRTEEGLIVIDDQNGFRAEERCFQMHAIFAVADSARYRPMHQRIFDAVRVHPWGSLALLGSLVDLLWIHRAIAEASWAGALSNTVKCWDLYSAEGPRFANGTRTGDLWALGSSLKAVLREKGVPVDELLAPLPPGGLRALLARHPDKFGCVLGTGLAEGA
jgi:hypothetical protein